MQNQRQPQLPPRRRSFLLRALFFLFKLGTFLALAVRLLTLHGWWYQTAAERAYPYYYERRYGAIPSDERSWYGAPSAERLSYNQQLADFAHSAFLYGGRILASIVVCIGTFFLWPRGGSSQTNEALACQRPRVRTPSTTSGRAAPIAPLSPTNNASPMPQTRNPALEDHGTSPTARLIFSDPLQLSERTSGASSLNNPFESEEPEPPLAEDADESDPQAQDEDPLEQGDEETRRWAAESANNLEPTKRRNQGCRIS